VSLRDWAAEKGSLLAGLASIEGKVGTEILREVSQTLEVISSKISPGLGIIKLVQDWALLN
jgi:hypothetical protein